MKKIITLLLLIVCACGAKAQIITTVAGGGTGGLGDGGPAVDCELYNPYGLAIDNAGNLYIADRGYNRIRKISADGIITTIAGTGSPSFSGDGGPATNASINFPLGVTFDVSNNIYFSDRDNNRVRKIDEAGIITTFAGNGMVGDTGDGGPSTAAEFNGPGSLKFDRFGNLYVSDLFNNRIRMVNTAGIITTIAGTGVSVNNGDGGLATAAGVYNPYGIVFDNTGNLYFTEYEGNRIRKINTAGIITTIAGNDTAGFRGDSGLAINAEVNHPDDIAIDASGNLYITDQGNQRVRKITTDGSINTIAGNGLFGYNGDSEDALLMEFKDPTGILIDHAGSLYIADLGNDRIRYIRNTVSVNTVNSLQNNVLIYPNPSDGTFNILVSSKTSKQVSVSIVDQLGRTIRQLPAQANEVTTVQAHIPPGVYFLLVKDGTNATETAKLFIR
jgi:sugar lactone lactonase YvrE